MLISTIRQQLTETVRGQENVIEEILLALLAGGHTLLEGVPGIGKTLLATTLAEALSMSFKRIQFTPDMLPSDVVGSVIYDMRESSFRVERGPLFANIVLADEINRTPPKTQAALLEAMEERQVTLYGETLALPQPFFVIATQNPIDYEGTYPLPEAQLDRFLMKIEIHYPDNAAQVAALLAHTPRHLARAVTAVEGSQTAVPARPVYARNESQDGARIGVDDAHSLLTAQQEVAAIEATEDVIRYIVELISQSRALASVSLGGSPRAAAALLMASKAS
ncbi:MAG: AAA family ATPase, partial [Bacilli bacterium]